MFLLYENKDRPWNPVNQGYPPHSMSCPQAGANPEGFKGGRYFKPSLKGKERRDRLWERCFLITEEQGRQHKGGSRKAVCLDSKGTPCQTWEILPQGNEITR